jgi:hypothetical protein
MTMIDSKIHDMPNTSQFMTRDEFVAWIASRKEAGAAIDIGTAELKGWWAPEGDAYFPEAEDAAKQPRSDDMGLSAR